MENERITFINWYRAEIDDEIRDQRINVVFDYFKRYHIDKLKADNLKLHNFKIYVHERLDKMGVPADPEPEANASHGCRIEGRLNCIQNEIDKLNKDVYFLENEKDGLIQENKKLRDEIQDLKDEMRVQSELNDPE